MAPKFQNILAVALGWDGAMFVGRIGSSGPEAVCPPIRWFHRCRSRYDREKDLIHHQLRLLVQEHRPRVLALEETRGAESLAWVAAGFSMAAGGCPRPPELVMRVPGQDDEARAEAWATLRPSFGEIMRAEDLREIDRIGKGEPGERVADACALLLAALPRWKGMRRGG